MQAVGLKTHIWNNNLRSAGLLIGFPILLIGMIYVLQLGLIAMGDLPTTGSLGGDMAQSFLWLAGSAPTAILVAGVWFVVAYFANTAIIAVATRAKPVSRSEQPMLYNLLENLAISRGLRTPRLHIIDSEAMNAFASGLNEKQYTITVTTGLLAALDRDELEAVLAHELTHVINRDVRTMVIASVFAGIISLLCEVIYRAVLYGGGRRSSSSSKKGGAWILVLAALAVAAIGYLLAVVIRMSLSRSREFVADAGAVELTKNPDAMITALRKISSGPALAAPEEVRGMFIENRQVGVNGLFATHPPIEKRIAALIAFAGGRDPALFDPPLSLEPEPEQSSGPWG